MTKSNTHPWTTTCHSIGEFTTCGRLCWLAQTHGALGANRLRMEKTVMMEKSQMRLVMPIGSLEGGEEEEEEEETREMRWVEGRREGEEREEQEREEKGRRRDR